MTGGVVMKLKKTGRAIRLFSGEYVRVDEEDYERLSQYSWHLFKSEKWQYAISNRYFSNSIFSFAVDYIKALAIEVNVFFF